MATTSSNVENINGYPMCQFVALCGMQPLPHCCNVGEKYCSRHISTMKIREETSAKKQLDDMQRNRTELVRRRAMENALLRQQQIEEELTRRLEAEITRDTQSSSTPSKKPEQSIQPSRSRSKRHSESDSDSDSDYSDSYSKQSRSRGSRSRHSRARHSRRRSPSRSSSSSRSPSRSPTPPPRRSSRSKPSSPLRSPRRFRALLVHLRKLRLCLPHLWMS